MEEKEIMSEMLQEEQEKTEGEEQSAESEKSTRDFSAEVEALLTAFPDMAGKSLPDEVVSRCISENIPLVRAYAAYRERSGRPGSAAEIFAPVRPVSKGAPVRNSPSDPFLEGLNSY